jgi:glycine oxidase
LGQAIRLRLGQPLGDPEFQPVITGNDIHLVPLGNQEYWVGATVEFSPAGQPLPPDAAQLEAVWQGAIGLCPELANATLLKTWFGLRPRPQNRPAPIVEPLADSTNVFLATGHYRNGVLLAPATAQLVGSALTGTGIDALKL